MRFLEREQALTKAERNKRFRSYLYNSALEHKDNAVCRRLKLQGAGKLLLSRVNEGRNRCFSRRLSGPFLIFTIGILRRSTISIAARIALQLSR
jgi:hypothetical protein